MAYRQVVRARGLGQAPSATAGASSVLTQPSGVNWSTVPWYAVPFVGVDVGVMKAYCLANATDPACTTAMSPTPPMPGGPGAPQTPAQMTVPGAYTPEQSATDQAAANAAAFQTFMNQLAGSGSAGNPPAPPGTACDTTAESWLDPTTWCMDHWLIASVAGVFAALMLVKALGGGR